MSKKKKSIGMLIIPWLGWIASIALGSVLSYLGLQPVPIPPIPMDSVPSQGWVDDPALVDLVVQGLEFKSFSQTPAGQNPITDPDHVYLWDSYRQLHGGLNPPAKNQRSVGSCVSFGTNNAIERTLCTEIVHGGKPFEFKYLCEEVTYAGSRVEIGKGRIRGDGSVGAWASQFVKDYGFASREVHGRYDLREYDESKCRDWGRSGVPDDLEPVVREHRVQEVTRVSSWVEARKALAQGYGIAICSGQGFSLQRDSRGVARAQGSWAHCMCLDGYHTENGQEFGHIENSWGAETHRGPVGWGNPSTAGFWAESRVIDGMLRQGDSWAFSAVKGFPARRLDWFVQQSPPRKSPLSYESFANIDLLRN